MLTKVLCNIFCLLNLLVISGPLTCWMWNSLNKMCWVDIRDGSCSLSYQHGSFLISTFSLFKIKNNMKRVK